MVIDVVSHSMQVKEDTGEIQGRQKSMGFNNALLTLAHYA